MEIPPFAPQRDKAPRQFHKGQKTWVRRAARPGDEPAKSDLPQPGDPLWRQKKLYTHRHREAWLKQLKQPGLLRRAERLYGELDLLQQLRRRAKQELMVESQSIPSAKGCAPFRIMVIRAECGGLRSFTQLLARLPLVLLAEALTGRLRSQGIRSHQ